MIMRDLIAKIVEGDDTSFEKLVEKLAQGRFFVFAKSEGPDELVIDFLSYTLEEDEEIDYIPIFTDQQEVDDFEEESPAPEEYDLYEFDGDMFSDLMEDDQYIMINPMTGGIVFQGEHLKAVVPPADEDE
jgi:hypothetical protein